MEQQEIPDTLPQQRRLMSTPGRRHSDFVNAVASYLVWAGVVLAVIGLLAMDSWLAGKVLGIAESVVVTLQSWRGS